MSSSIYEWIIDNNLTPHLLVDVTHPHAALPKDYIEDNKIVLNMRPEAIQGLALENTTICYRSENKKSSLLLRLCFYNFQQLNSYAFFWVYFTTRK
jgi:stringent starvation protein B